MATIEAMIRAGASCLSVEAGRTLLFDRGALLERARQAGIAIVAASARIAEAAGNLLSGSTRLGMPIPWSLSAIPCTSGGLLVRKTLLFAFAATLIAAVYVRHRSRADDAATMPAAGQKAPTFTLPSQDGTPISLSSTSGKWVVLYFYPKDMTTGLHHRGPQFPERLPQFDAKNAVDSGRERGLDRQPSAVLRQGWPDLPPALGHRAQGGEQVRLAGRH